MIVGYVAARTDSKGKIDLYSKGIGATPEEGAALATVARIEYPTLFTAEATKVYELHDPEAADARQMMAMATIGGARVLGLGALTGSLEPGKRADIVRFDGDSFGAAIVHDPYQQIVYGAGPESVADVWVDGRQLLRGGAFTQADPKGLVPRVRELATALAKAGAITSFSCLAH